MKKPKQLSLAETGFTARKGKTTRKEEFLSQMDAVVPWSALEALIEPHYHKSGS
jgi:IS5 family transposase